MPQCAGLERYTHRWRVVGTHMSWLIAFEDTVSSANCAVSKTGGHIPEGLYRVCEGYAAGNSKFRRFQQWKG